MQEVLAMTYYWLKAGHIIFVVFWMAGLFMLPRLFVYHQECDPDSPENALWIERERKLLKIILMPVDRRGLGARAALAFAIDAWGQGWLYAKLALVLGLSAITATSRLREQARARASGRFRQAAAAAQRGPGVAVALIVVLVVIKPF
jgi:putative membrane protein